MFKFKINFNATTKVQCNKKNPEKRVVYLLKKKVYTDSKHYSPMTDSRVNLILFKILTVNLDVFALNISLFSIKTIMDYTTDIFPYINDP